MQSSMLMNAKARQGLIELHDKVKKTFEAHEKTINERLDHLTLLKEEQRCEIKRLYKQHMATSQDYDQQKERIVHLGNKVDEFDSKLKFSEAANATIFKLLRVQYALAH